MTTSKKLSVSNIDLSIYFYHKVFGLKLLYREDFPEQRSTSACLVNNQQTDGSVLILNQNWTHSKDEVDSQDDMLDLEVDHVLQTCEQVKYAGGELLLAPNRFQHPKSLMAYIKDPDGYLIRISEQSQGFTGVAAAANL